MVCVDLVIRIVSSRRGGSGLCRGRYSLSGAVSTVMLEEKEENDQNMLSARGIIGRLRYSLCTFELEVQNIYLRTALGGDTPTCALFSSSWLNVLLKCGYGQHESTALE